MSPAKKRIEFTMLGLIGLSVTSTVVPLMVGQFAYVLGIMIAWGVIGLAFVCFLFLLERHIRYEASKCHQYVADNIRSNLKDESGDKTYYSLSRTIEDRDVDKFSNLVKLFSVDYTESWIFLYLFDNAPIKKKERKVIFGLIKVVFRRKKDGLEMYDATLDFFFMEMTPRFVPVSLHTLYIIYFLCRLCSDHHD